MSCGITLTSTSWVGRFGLSSLGILGNYANALYCTRRPVKGVQGLCFARQAYLPEWLLMCFVAVPLNWMKECPEKWHYRTSPGKTNQLHAVRVLNQTVLSCYRTTCFGWLDCYCRLIVKFVWCAVGHRFALPLLQTLCEQLRQENNELRKKMEEDLQYRNRDLEQLR